MTIPLCLEIPELPDAFELSLPGGVTIQRINLLEVIQPLLAPLMPVFEIIDTVVAVFNCIKAIPDSLGPPPDPTVLAACIPELAEKVGKLLRLLPQLSLPVLLQQLCKLVVGTLQEARMSLVHLQGQMERILGAVDRASELEDSGMMAIIACAKGNVAQEAANVGKMLGSLGRLIGIINIFFGLLGLAEVPDLSSVSGKPLDAAIESLDSLISLFEAAAAAVPIP